MLRKYFQANVCESWYNASQHFAHDFMHARNTQIDASARKVRDAASALRDHSHGAIDAYGSRELSAETVKGVPPEPLRVAIGDYVKAWRSAQATPERMLIELKEMLHEVTADADPEIRRRVSAEIVSWSIEEYYRD
jgi:hypothetical protein